MSCSLTQQQSRQELCWVREDDCRHPRMLPLATSKVASLTLFPKASIYFMEISEYYNRHVYSDEWMIGRADVHLLMSRMTLSPRTRGFALLKDDDDDVAVLGFG